MKALMSLLHDAGRRVIGAPERRLHRQAMQYWHAQRRGREFPVLEEFDFFELEDRSTYAFLLDVGDRRRPILSQVGAVLLNEADLSAVPAMLDDVAPTSLVGQFGRRWEQVLMQRQPIASEYDFITEAGYRVSCRGVLLPLSSNGTAIDRIYGVIRWKSEKVGENARSI